MVKFSNRQLHHIDIFNMIKKSNFHQEVIKRSSSQTANHLVLKEIDAWFGINFCSKKKRCIFLKTLLIRLNKEFLFKSTDPNFVASIFDAIIEFCM